MLVVLVSSCPNIPSIYYYIILNIYEADAQKGHCLSFQTLKVPPIFAASLSSHFAMSVSDLPYPHFVPYHHHHLHQQHPHHRFSFPDGQNFPLSSSPAPYQVPPLFQSLSAITHDVSQAPRNSSLNQSRINPAFTTMNTLSTEEMERFQKLSNEFEADVQVWQRRPFPKLDVGSPENNPR